MLSLTATARRRRANRRRVHRPPVDRRLVGWARTLLSAWAGSVRRLAVTAAVLGLMVQLALPFTPMADTPIPVPQTRAEAIALWGPDSLCSAQDQRKDDGHRHGGRLHCNDCPICQAQHQLTQLIPPLPGALIPPASEPAGLPAPRDYHAWFDRAAALHRSRGPPLALI